jgi:hypothetical protein
MCRKQEFNYPGAFMAVSSIPAASVQPYQPVKPMGRDADGDNDGSKAASAPATPQPQLPNPTATMGNNVNTTA